MSGAALPARGPFRLAAVAVSHGWFQTAPFAWDRATGGLSRVEALEGAVALRVEAAPGGVVMRAARPLSPAEAREAERRVRRMLQLDADLDGFLEAVREVDPALADDLAAYGAGRLLAGPTLWEDVVKAICATNVTWRQAVGMINRVAGLGRDGAFPAPADLLRAGEEWMRAVGRVGYRAPALIAAARAAIDGTLADLEAAAAEGGAEAAVAGLRGLAGVGPATAGFLALLMGHFDRPSVDSATIRVATDAWFGGRRPAPREVLGRVAPAGRFSGLVLAWATLRAWQRESGVAALA